jgi:hypothetical protein
VVPYRDEAPMKAKAWTLLLFAQILILVFLCTLLTAKLVSIFQPRISSKVLPDTGKEIVIHVQYDRSLFFPKEWLREPIRCEGAQVEVSETQRVIPIIETFESVFYSKTLRKNLTDIYLVSELKCYGKTFGGTNSRTSIYLNVGPRNKGYSDGFILSTLHAEYSSILMRNYAFPTKAWSAINDNDFTYPNNEVQVVEQNGLYTQTPDLLAAGFLDNYAATSLENDFNEFASWLFVRSEDLCRLQANYRKINQKAVLAENFYSKIDPTLRWPVCA